MQRGAIYPPGYAPHGSQPSRFLLATRLRRDTLRVQHIMTAAPHSGSQREPEMAAFKITDITRNRTVGWGTMPEDAKPGTVAKPRAITTADFTDKDGNVLTGDALAARIKTVKGTVAADQIGYITVSDLPSDYAKDARAALTKLAAEWSDGAKDADGKPVKWSPDDVMHYLVLQSRMQDAANASIKQHRPVSDKALDRTVSTLVKTMKNNGKTIVEVLAVLTATGATFTEASVRETYGT